MVSGSAFSTQSMSSHVYQPSQQWPCAVGLHNAGLLGGEEIAIRHGGHRAFGAGGPLVVLMRMLHGILLTTHRAPNHPNPNAQTTNMCQIEFCSIRYLEETTTSGSSFVKGHSHFVVYLSASLCWHLPPKIPAPRSVLHRLCDTPVRVPLSQDRVHSASQDLHRGASGESKPLSSTDTLEEGGQGGKERWPLQTSHVCCSCLVKELNLEQWPLRATISIPLIANTVSICSIPYSLRPPHPEPWHSDS